MAKKKTAKKTVAKKLPWRPTKYSDALCKKAEEYLKLNKDEFWTFIKGDGPKGSMYERMVHVKLPTIRSFAQFIKVDESTVYDWAKKYPQFSKSLESIKVEQEQRLLNHGLSGEYNSTIAKLILSSNHGYREKNDLTTDGQPIPQPIINVPRNHGNASDQGATEKD